ncbi:MAG TPA: hypothetical protein VFI65_32260 [Streptosporangiaceae bacterium]|nr:hypothetical protein [Streptosporangiaceae bacterium]
MRGERVLVNQIRELMEPSNPVPATRYQGEAPYQVEIAALLTDLRSAPPEEAAPVDPVRDRPGRRRGRDTTWRVLAPVLSGLAVIAVVTSLTVAAGQEPSRSKSGPRTPTAAGLPRYFATVTGRGGLKLQIHRTSTGHVVAALPIPASGTPIRAVAASSSGRVFYIAVDRFNSQEHEVIAVFKAQQSKSGRWTIGGPQLNKLLPQASDTFMNGVGVSPDGSRLALTLERLNKSRVHTELVVVPTNGKGAARVWSAPAVPAYALDPVWTDNHDLAFLWQDRLTGSETKFGGRSQERVLDTSRPGSNLLAAKVLITSPTGVMETAFASPHGGPIFATIANDSPAKGIHGVATVRLVWFTPHQSGFTILATHKAQYNSLLGKEKNNLFFQVLGLDPSGQHALVDSPNLAVMTTFKIRPLPGVHGSFSGAAW